MNHSTISITTAVSLITLMPVTLAAAGSHPSSPYMDWAMQNIIVILGGLVILLAAITLWDLGMTMLEHHRREALRAQGIDPSTFDTNTKASWWSRLYAKAWSLVPLDHESDIDLGHDYDGIRELDNSLPPWWLYGFYLSIMIAVGYIYVYHFSDLGHSQEEEYQIAMQEAKEQIAAFTARQPNSIDEDNLVALTDEDAMKVGRRVYISSCAACHGQEGQGGVGPNLTDDYWLHGGHIRDVYTTIKNGVPEKGMIAWKAQLEPTTIHKVASYIRTLRGTSPPNPKAKQGERYQEPLAIHKDITEE